jgi:pimeloyl-ACP methyl ester carboxylesterase
MSTGVPMRLSLADGRTLAYEIYGAREGDPVYVFHGLPGSRLQAAFLHDKAAAAGLCLISPDRPGFGLSSASPQRTVLGWAQDVRQLADHLGHARFDVLGISCGGAYALACAHELPTRIGSVGLMAGMGPMDLPAIRRKQMPVLRLMFALARVQPWLVSPMLALDRLMYRGDPKRAVRTVAALLTEPDRLLLRDNALVADGFASSLAEGYRQGVRAAMLEARLIASPRNFALERIGVPVHVFQGEHDRHVPPEMGAYLARTLPRATLHRRPDDGHLSIVWNCFEDYARQRATARTQTMA